MTKKSEQGITVEKDKDFSEWFTQVVQKAELAEYSSVSGCLVYRPRVYALWEKIVKNTDEEFKKIGIQNSYFPLLIPESLFAKEGDFVKGFAPEVAWVTQGGNTKLGEKLAIRPTSEAIMYESYSKWIRSWRDLPLLLNQWNNVVRWEFNNPAPFFRGREFLWNELHTCFATEKEALEHGEKVMEAYRKITEDLMAIPGIYGKKTDREKFAGGVFSKKVHTYLPNGRVLEGTCFHHDGQNFAKAYNIKFKDENEKEKFAWQNTHAISTRMLGGMIALHSDDKGLVVPPRIAQNKFVIVPIFFEKNKKVLEEAKKINKELSEFEPILDLRLEVTPGWKFNEWELKGVPLRIELGPKDLEKKQVVVVKRNTGEKILLNLKDLKKEIFRILEEMQNEMYLKAEKLLKENICKTENKKDLIKFIKDKKIVIVPLKNDEKCEEILKADTGGAKVLFIDPENNSVKNKKCIISGEKADYWVYVGKTY